MVNTIFYPLKIQMIEFSTAHDSECDCHEVKQRILCLSLPKVMKAMKPEDNTTTQFQDQFTSSLLEIIENRRQDNKPIYLCVLKALSEMMLLLGCDSLKRYAYILVFHFDSILSAKGTATETNTSDEMLSLTIISIGNFFYTLKLDSTPYLDAMMKLLVNLKEMAVKVRSQCIATLGKIAAAVGNQRFIPYLPVTLLLLQDSSNLAATISSTVSLFHK